MAPETIGGVGIKGTGGDPELNREKNRYAAPKNITDLTVANIMGISTSLPSEAGRERRDRWSGSERDYVASEEALGVRVTGYLIHAKQSGPESCNGYSDSLVDYHIWIGDSPEDSKSEAMIVEMTPRWKSLHPEWQLHTLEQLAEHHAKVRITGWLMWDEEHPEEVGKSRGSQWEVHPVTNFEVYSGQDWAPLESGRTRN